MRKKHPRNLSEEQIQELANKCESRTEFSQRFSGAYQQARKRGLLDKVCSHMVRRTKPMYYWTRERLQAVAKKYEYRNDFYTTEPTAYNRASQLGLLDEVCAHMKRPISTKRIREADSDTVLKSIAKTLSSSRRTRAVSYRYANAATNREVDSADYNADWTMQLYDQMAHEHEDRAINHIETLKHRGDHKAVDAAWQLFINHMDGNWCTAAG
jgi:hypothetical protein